MMAWTRYFFFVAFMLIPLRAAVADGSLPGYLGISEIAPGTFHVVWRPPSAQGPPLLTSPFFPKKCVEVAAAGTPAPVLTANSQWLLHCSTSSGLIGTIGVAGLEATDADVLVRIDFLGGRDVTHMLRASEPRFEPDAEKVRIDIFGYFRLGITHILGGLDHLLFVATLVLLVRRLLPVAKTVTAFTLAHSITLAGATLGLVHVSPRPVEATIALSIVFMARELINVRRGAASMTSNFPWMIAFAFGLLHGFGFAGALTEIGLPDRGVPLALLLFNLGVEVGQLVFVFGLLLVGRSMTWMNIKLPKMLAESPSYAIGALATFWFMQRVMIIF